MSYYTQQQRSMGGGSSTQPPSYRLQKAYSQDEEQDRGQYFQRPTSNAHLMPPGANSFPPDTPSAYSDPYEYNSAVVSSDTPRAQAGGANVLSTRPDVEYLAQDQYDEERGGRQERMNLGRSNTTGTLGPGDSISAYNVDAISRDLAERPRHQGDFSQYTTGPYSYNHHHAADETQDFYDPSYHPYERSGDDVPLRNYATGMGYAEDEDQEHQQRASYWHDYPSEKWEPDHHAPDLFANDMQGGQQQIPIEEFEKEDRKGLLSMLSPSHRNGPKPGWGGTLDEQIARRRKGIGRQRWPILTWLLTIAYIVVFIIELIQGKQKTGQAIQTTPSWNPMLGPSFEFLISFGARFVPCMRKVPDIPTSTEMACLQYSTSSSLSSLTSNELCPIWQLCGLANADTTNQSYRFITPIFIHAGFVHILFNLMVQLTLCAQIEKLISTPFYALVYFAGGIGGNLLGANFGLVGQPSVGASGAIYTCISVELIDLCYNWKYEYRPRTRLIVSICFAIIGFAIGLLPGLDNFAHIGGFAVGTLGGLIFCPAIHASKQHRIITWVLRIVAAALLVGFFVGLSTNFYSNADPATACKWCRYMSCLPTFSQCKGNGLTTTSSPSSG